MNQDCRIEKQDIHGHCQSQRTGYHKSRTFAKNFKNSTLILKFATLRSRKSSLQLIEI